VEVVPPEGESQSNGAMSPSHLPLTLLLAGGTLRAPTDIASLVRTNLGPLLGPSGRVYCGRMGQDDVECEVFVP